MPNPRLRWLLLPASICQRVKPPQTVSLSKLANSTASVTHRSSLTRNVCSDFELSAKYKSAHRCRQGGVREADEDILCSMKDGGSRSLRPRWWHYIDLATAEPEVQAPFGFVSTAQLSMARLPPSPSLIAVRNPGVKTQTKGEAKMLMCARGARQVGLGLSKLLLTIHFFMNFRLMFTDRRQQDL